MHAAFRRVGARIGFERRAAARQEGRFAGDGRGGPQDRARDMNSRRRPSKRSDRPSGLFETSKGRAILAFEARLAALGNEAQDLITQALDTFLRAVESWEAKDSASFIGLMREVAEKIRLVADLYDSIARECERVNEKPS